MVYILFFIGLVLVIKCSDVFVELAVWLAKTFKIPDVIIGATLVSICTTLPEAIISITSSLEKMPNMAFGNAAGSISFNTGIIMSIIFLFSSPKSGQNKFFFKNTFILIGAILFVIISIFFNGFITRTTGIILLILFIVYMIYNLEHAKRQNSISNLVVVNYNKQDMLKNTVLFFICAFGVLYGSNLMVDNAKSIASSLGVSDMIIGLALTGAGSSMPELMTSLSAIRKKAGNISVGNIIGANILNVLFVIGASAAVYPIRIDKFDAIFHLTITLIFSFAILILGLLKSEIKRKLFAAFMTGFYILYLYLSLSF
jgi:cation:H+ antiporter